MSALIALLPFLLKYLPIILSLFGIVPAALSHSALSAHGMVGANQDYMLHVAGQGIAGLILGGGGGEMIKAWGLSLIRNAEIGCRLRTAAGLDSKSSDNEINSAVKRLG